MLYLFNMKTFDKLLIAIIGIIIVVALVGLITRNGNIQKQNRILQQQIFLDQQDDTDTDEVAIIEESAEPKPIIVKSPEPNPFPTPLPAPIDIPNGGLITLALNQEHTLGQEQGAILEDIELMVTVAGFSNSPCPDDAQCIWSGVGIFFDYWYGGESGSRTLDYRDDLGTQTIIEKGGIKAQLVETDLETYAVIRFVAA